MNSNWFCSQHSGCIDYQSCVCSSYLSLCEASSVSDSRGRFCWSHSWELELQHVCHRTQSWTAHTRVHLGSISNYLKLLITRKRKELLGRGVYLRLQLRQEHRWIQEDSSSFPNHCVCRMRKGTSAIMWCSNVNHRRNKSFEAFQVAQKVWKMRYLVGICWEKPG